MVSGQYLWWWVEETTHPAAMADTEPTLSSQAKARSFSKAGISDARTAKTMIIRECTSDTTCIDLQDQNRLLIPQRRAPNPCQRWVSFVGCSPIILGFPAGFPKSFRKKGLTKHWGDN
jgi:hypothetical protein